MDEKFNSIFCAEQIQVPLELPAILKVLSLPLSLLNYFPITVFLGLHQGSYSWSARKPIWICCWVLFKTSSSTKFVVFHFFLHSSSKQAKILKSHFNKLSLSKMKFVWYTLVLEISFFSNLVWSCWYKTWIWTCKGCSSWYYR